MLFSVIYSVDVPSNEEVMEFAPPDLDQWDQTEGDESFEYSYLEGKWEEGHHRKWSAMLNRKQFDAFINRCGLLAEDVKTMGSLGAPGFGYGWAPAMSFWADDPVAIANAYVTPIPETTKSTYNENDWERVRGAVLSVYG